MWLYLLIGYFLIGLNSGINHLSSGRVGAKGPFATILAFIFLWPVLIVLK